MKVYIGLFVLALLCLSKYAQAECMVRAPESFKFLYVIRTYGESYRGYSDEEIESLEKEYVNFNVASLRSLRANEKSREDEFYSRRYAKYVVLRQVNEKFNKSKFSEPNDFDMTYETFLEKEFSADALELDLKNYEKKSLVDMDLMHKQEMADYHEALDLRRIKIQRLKQSKVYALPVVKTINGDAQKILKNITVTQGDAPDLLPGGTYIIPLDSLEQKKVNTCDIQQVSGPHIRPVGE